MSNPSKLHFRALDYIWKYLNKYPELGLEYTKETNNLTLKGYTDADWAGDRITRRSTSGYIFQLNNNIISYNSTQQKTVALSSTEAEYMALKDFYKEAIYLDNSIKYLKDNLKISLINYKVPILFTDNQSAQKLAENPEFHKRSKYIDI
jgi:hypothetical protein